MLTREQIEEIQSESREKGLLIKKLLEVKGIPAHQYFWWKRKYVREQIAEGFLPVAGAMPPSVMSGMSTCSAAREKSKASPAAENWMNIELRTVNGTDMRKNFNMLSGIVNNCMQQNLYSVDVFVFVNASNNMLKLLRYEPGGLVIYNKRLDHGRMHLVERAQEGDPETWMEVNLLKCPPKSLMEEAISYTYRIIKKLALYVTDGRYKIDDNMVENSIRPLAIGRKNYLFCGDDEAAQRAAVVYSLLATCKARGIDERAWLEDILRRIPQYELGKKDFTDLLPGNWSPVAR